MPPIDPTIFGSMPFAIWVNKLAQLAVFFQQFSVVIV